MKFRWQDWANVLLGAALLSSPEWMGYALDGAATKNAYGLGAVLVIYNLIAACRLIDRGEEILNIVLGLWLAMSPYILGFYANPDPTLIARAAGTAVTLLAIWQLRDATRSRKRVKDQSPE